MAKSSRTVRLAGLAAALLLGHVLGAAPAAADALTLAGREILLLPPAGSCAYDPNDPGEAGRLERFGETQGSAGRLLLAFADCTEFERARSGEWDQLVDQGQVALLLKDGKPAVATAVDRAHFVAALAAAQKAAPGPVPGQPAGARMVGVLDQDDSALYLGVALPQGLDGAPQERAGVVALTMVNYLPIALSLYGPSGGDAALHALIEAQRANVRKLIAANAMVEQTAGPPLPPPSPFGRIAKLLVVAIAVLAIGGTVLFIRAYRRR